jgi:hypothetical protein
MLDGVDGDHAILHSPAEARGPGAIIGDEAIFVAMRPSID